MSKYSFISELNKQQKIAATTTEGPLLILAGAGTGKTKTMIARTAYIIVEKKAKPEEILITTFTNKAAREMKERGSALLKENDIFITKQPEFTTFHSWGFRFLKSLDQDILNTFSLRPQFNIADESEQIAILSKIRNKVFKKDEKKLSINNFLLPLGSIQNSLINYYSQKDALAGIITLLDEDPDLFSDCYTDEIDMEFLNRIALLYVEYKRTLRLNNIVDFEDIITLPIQVFNIYPEIKERIRNKYKYIMVDEFQDTNGSQELLLDLIMSDDKNIAVVGDDSQSIYGWRGAKIEFILNFHNKNENTKVINLKINYRSCTSIIKKANSILKYSKQVHELKEKLKAHTDKEGLVRSKMFKTSEDEAEYVSSTIKQIIKKKGATAGITILYRAAYINRKIETELIFNQIPYKIHRGKALLDRKSAKAIINYMKFLNNNSNSIALSNVLFASGILSMPRASLFLNNAEEGGETLYSYIASKGYMEIKGLRSSSKEKLDIFVDEIHKFKMLLKTIDFNLFVLEFFKENVVTQKNIDIVEKNLAGEDVSEASLKDANTSLNIISVVQTLMSRYDSIEDFLEAVSLEGEEEDADESKVNLMTVHASKGLEFKFVFLMGFTQGVFPGQRSDIEEERRLAYVALTRAKSALFVTGAQRYFPGGPNMIMSQFAEEAGLL